MKTIGIIISIISIILGLSMLTNENLIIEYPALPYIIMVIGLYYIVDAIYLYLQRKKDY